MGPNVTDPPRVPSARRRLWALVAKAWALALATFAGWMVILGCKALWTMTRDRPELGVVLVAVLLGVVALGVLALALWLAWQLWRHWSADTVRLVVGLLAGAAALYVASAVHAWLAAVRPAALDPLAARLDAGWGFGLKTLLSVFVALWIYRRLTRAVIRWAALDDPRDPHGHPPGHMARARLFCGLVGWAVFLAASDLATLVREPALVGVGFLVAVALGLIAHRGSLWYLTPKTLPALPPGRGFEVVPVAKRRA